MPIHNSILKTVVTINSYDKESLFCIGTGFIVGYPLNIDGQRRFDTFIITNKHVMENKDSLIISINKKSGGVQHAEINKSKSIKRKEIFSHPNKDVDVCAIHLNYNYVKENDCDIAFIDLESYALTINKMKNYPVYEGNIVYAVGFPMNLVDVEFKYPIVRMGNLARISDLYFTDKSIRKFTVDTECYPGNSGSPIFLSIENQKFKSNSNIVDRNYLIGVLNSYIPYQETLISTQTGKPRFIQEENSGLTEVFSVDYILDVIEMFDRINELEKKIDR